MNPVFSFFFFSAKKIEQLQNDNHNIELTLMYTPEKITAVYYNIIITYERYWLDIALNVSLHNSILAALLGIHPSNFGIR